jgi:tetratricopeptide (TPR) repeat protein
MADTSAPSSIHALAAIQLAQIVELAGARLEDAVEIGRHAQQLDPYEPAIAYLLAHYAIQMGDMRTAEEQLRAALDIDPLYPGALRTMRAVRCTSRVSMRRSYPPRTRVCSLGHYPHRRNHRALSRPPRQPHRRRVLLARTFVCVQEARMNCVLPTIRNNSFCDQRRQDGRKRCTQTSLKLQQACSTRT